MGSPKMRSRSRVSVMRPIQVVALVLAVLLSPPIRATQKPLLPTPEDVAGEWLGLDCTAEVWRIALRADGAGAVAFGTAGYVYSHLIAAAAIRDRELTLTVSRSSTAEGFRLRGRATPDDLRLGVNGSKSCPIAFLRASKLESALAETAAALKQGL